MKILMTKENIWKLITILTFRVHVNLKTVFLFNSEIIKQILKITQEVWEARPGYGGRSMPPAPNFGYGPAIS